MHPHNKKKSKNVKQEQEQGEEREEEKEKESEVVVKQEGVLEMEEDKEAAEEAEDVKMDEDEKDGQEAEENDKESEESEEEEEDNENEDEDDDKEENDEEEDNEENEAMDIEAQGETLNNQISLPPQQQQPLPRPSPRHIFKAPLDYFNLQQPLIVPLRLEPKQSKNKKEVTTPQRKGHKDRRLRNGMLTVSELGTLPSPPSPNFCTNDLLFPVGYHAQRFFWSYKEDKYVKWKENAPTIEPEEPNEWCNWMYEFYKEGER